MEDSKEYKGVFTIADAIEATAAELEKLNDTLNNWVDDTHDPIDDKYYEALKTRAVLNDHVLRWLVELRDIKNGNDAAKFEEIYQRGYERGRKAATPDGQKATAPVKRKYKYIVVRSYADNKTSVKKAFENGFEFVRASDIVPNGISNYIEYILRKEINGGGETTC